MMLPVALAVIKEVKANDILSGASLDRFSKSILLSVAYSASIGGLATLVGSVPNAVFAAMSKKLLDREIMFFEWFLFGFPVAAVLLILLFLYLTKIQFKVEHTGEMGAAFIRKGLEDLGKMKQEEKSRIMSPQDDCQQSSNKTIRLPRRHNTLSIVRRKKEDLQTHKAYRQIIPGSLCKIN